MEDRDARIHLDETNHKYFVDGRCEYISTTQFKQQYFQSAYESKKSLYDEAYRDVDHPNSDLTKEEEKNRREALNERKRDKGVELHGWIEQFYSPKTDEKCVTNRDYLAVHLKELSDQNMLISDLDYADRCWINFIKFVVAHLDWELVRMEWRIFHDKYKIAGTPDAIFKMSMPDGSHRVVLCDWKTVTNLRFESKDKMGNMGKFAKLTTFDSTNYWEYHIQLNIYRIILEDYYNFKIDHMIIVRLAENCGNFKLYFVERDENFRVILEDRIKHFDWKE